jgi:hypothetical protein
MKIDFNSVIKILDTVNISQFGGKLNDNFTRNSLISKLSDTILDLYPDMGDGMEIICDTNLNTPEIINAFCLRFSLSSEGVTVFVTIGPQKYVDLRIDPPIVITSGITK